MNKITIITNSDHETLVKEFNSKLEEGINQFVLGLHESKTILFENVENLSNLEVINYDVLIVEDELATVLDYIKILNDAPLIKNIVVTTKPKTTKTVLDYLSNKNLLDKLKVIFLDFNLKESTIDTKVNGSLANRNWENIYLAYFKNQIYPPKVFGITGYEGVDANEYTELQNQMRQNDDFVISKSFLNDKVAKELFISFLKSIPGLYWEGAERKAKKEEIAKTENSSESENYEKKYSPPKNIDHAKRLLNNIEAALPEVSSGKKFEISKDFINVIKPGETDTYSKQQTLHGALVSAASGIFWLLRHPANRVEFPKFRHQYNAYGVFKTQLDNGIKNKK